jgi:hypothetical protein
MPDRLSGLIFAQIAKRSIVHLSVFPSLTNPHIVTNEVQLLAVAPEPCALVISCHRDALNPDLGHEAVIVVFTV